MEAVPVLEAAALVGSARNAGLLSMAVEPKVIDREVSAVPDALVQEWRALVDNAAEPNSFAEPWFVEAGLRNLAGGDAVRLVEIWEGSGLIGLIFLCVGACYARMRVRHLRNWSHHHHFLGTPLVRKGSEAAFFRALLQHLDRDPAAPAFLHLENLVSGGPVHRGLAAAACSLGRATPVVHRHVRALLDSELDAKAYYEKNVRKKKRKELKRLCNRLEELGQLATRRLTPGEELGPWCDRFLALEASGWKGRAGSALAFRTETDAFFREALAGALAAERLEFLSLELDGRPIAMLANFLASPGSFSFKIAIDEEFARYSPGVLLEIENLAILERPEIAWMDSCASPHHPMIESLWAERRDIIRVTVRLGGFRRAAVYYACRALEIASAARRRLTA